MALMGHTAWNGLEKSEEFQPKLGNIFRRMNSHYCETASK